MGLFWTGREKHRLNINNNVYSLSQLRKVTYDNEANISKNISLLSNHTCQLKAVFLNLRDQELLLVLLQLVHHDYFSYFFNYLPTHFEKMFVLASFIKFHLTLQFQLFVSNRKPFPLKSIQFKHESQNVSHTFLTYWLKNRNLTINNYLIVGKTNLLSWFGIILCFQYWISGLWTLLTHRDTWDNRHFQNM